MSNPKNRRQYFFVDESGDPTFFNKKGEVIIGSNGCSPILLLGFIKTDAPHELRQKILSLHKEIAADEYLKAIPSITKTNITFHAKDDVPEVREKVLKVLKKLPFKSEFVVARKRLDVFTKRHKREEDVFYNELITRLFENQLHKTDNIIYFAKRGNKNKQHHLENAIQTALINFEGKYSKQVDTKTKVFIQIPSDEPCLQVIDYLNWIVQRAFIRGEMRFFDFLKEKISLIVDIYDFDKYPDNFYNKRNNPFDVTKLTPINKKPFNS